MCDCRAKTEERLLARFKEQSPEAADHRVSLTGYALIVTKDMGLVAKGCMPIKASAKFPIKKGGTKEKKIEQNMIFNFCPFCGEKYSEEIQ